MKRTFLIVVSVVLAAMLAPTGAAGAQGATGPRTPTPDAPYRCASPPHQIPPPDLPHNQKPYIIRTNPYNKCKISDTTPTIRATVGDDTADLRKRDIRFYFDGERKRTFSYDRTTGKLVYARAKPVGLGKHTVKIVAVDKSEPTPKKRVTQWSFEVVAG